ncbi:CHAT domain-containing protein [Bradyrhizobium diazoefficiens]
MAFRQYRDFILVADDVKSAADGSPEQFTISVFDSPVGQSEWKEEVRVPAALNQMARWLDNRQLDNELHKQIELGKTIAAMLLPSHARKMFYESLIRLPPDQGLRLRLRLHDALADIPWEYAYLQNTRGELTADGFLALDPRISIARHEALNVPGDWFEAPSRRRVLVAMASPRPHEKYRKLQALPREQQQIRKALAALAGVEAVFVPIFPEGGDGDIPGVTVGLLAEALTERTDIFHFSGHGEFIREMTSQEGQGALLFADAAGEAFPVSSTKLAELLKSKGVRLAVLGACEGGRRDGINMWSGVAAALLRVGIPAVVAMQYSIDDNLAAAFMTAFYQSLVAGSLIDEAVAIGRAAIRIKAADSKPEIRDWGVPVLYLRSPGGAVFNPVSDKAAVQAAASAVEQLVEQRLRTVATEGRAIGAVIDTVDSGTSVTIDQKVEQEMKGFMLGAHAFNLEGGRLRVIQQADVVSGTLVGLRIGDPQSRNAATKAGQDPVSQLEKLLRLS